MAALDAEALRAALVGPYAALDVVGSTGSTNADLVAAATSGAPDRTVLIAEQQTAGRGRRARDWVSPPAAGLYLSVLLRPAGVPTARFGALSLVAGVALVRTARHAGVVASLKWPNDLLAGASAAKCAGVLAEASAGDAPAVVVGIGLNVGALPGEVPLGPGGLPATSFAQEGGLTDRTEVAIALLRAFDEAERSWRGAQGDLATSGLLAEYRSNCATLGQRVRVELPNGVNLQGLATDIDADGQLVVDVGGTARTLSAGDVVHVRPSS
ncbi:biotin--[acetyl-CoA-carboxylase] ligase [Actinokineospora sp. NBRC 105648]|uniref:biotin--[acetyl-CoA-carboxylase] ligase n=1 Tax=Actinokineospora sp. NBRC 105648 TaxID=3032206 RepID=UPI0024A4F187|nr:biotin--[acetyl-CoA-carboxylase] ligase [Actinokineospora sp. NBRC 105648]GLZ38550.1 biotin--[acetyl-CoA-carboxylase] ligase [Actinokineospora sp. NBRC 105648]